MKIKIWVCVSNSIKVFGPVLLRLCANFVNIIAHLFGGSGWGWGKSFSSFSERELL